jgi:hypothetical protein
MEAGRLRWRQYTRLVEASGDRWSTEAFVTVAVEDQDQPLGESATILLIQSRQEPEQLALIEPRLPDAWNVAQNRLAERRVLIHLGSADAEPEAFVAAAKTSTRNVQLWLLDQAHLPNEAIEILANDGATRAIRNRAKERLGSGNTELPEI